jgi:hypothetical protein
MNEVPQSRADSIWREAEPRQGKARVRANLGKLRAGIVVDVVRLSQDGMVADVETNWGLNRRMFWHQLDFGYEFRTKGGEWIPEGDARALRWLRRVRDELASGKPPRHPGEHGNKLDAATVEKILRRNGAMPH